AVRGRAIRPLERQSPQRRRAGRTRPLVPVQPIQPRPPSRIGLPGLSPSRQQHADERSAFAEDRRLPQVSRFRDGGRPLRLPGVERLPGTLLLRHYDEGGVICRQGEAGWTAFYVLTSEDVAGLKQALLDAATDPAEQQALAAEVETWRKRAAEVRRDEEGLKT